MSSAKPAPLVTPAPALMIARAMTYQTILLDISDNVGRITLNRPDKLNSFTPEMHLELRDAIEKVAREARAMLLTGAGRGFCAGQDLSQRRQMGGEGESPPGLGRITLNHPDKLNSFTPELHLELHVAIETVARDARAMLLTGAGRGFCAGHDLSHRRQMGVEGETPPDLGQTIATFYNPLVKRL